MDELPLFKISSTPDTVFSVFETKFTEYMDLISNDRDGDQRLENKNSKILKTTLYNWLKCVHEYHIQNPNLYVYEEYYATFRFPNYNISAVALIKFI